MNSTRASMFCCVLYVFLVTLEGGTPRPRVEPDSTLDIVVCVKVCQWRCRPRGTTLGCPVVGYVVFET